MIALYPNPRGKAINAGALHPYPRGKVINAGALDPYPRGKALFRSPSKSSFPKKGVKSFYMNYERTNDTYFSFTLTLHLEKYTYICKNR